MEEMLRVGVISSTHGVRGEVKVYPTTDDSERFLDLDQVTLDTGREQITLEIQNVKFFKNMVILKFKGYDNINDIEKYKGKDLLIHRDQAVELKEDEYFVTDLMGLKVVSEEGTVLGILKEVIPTGANDVYVVQPENGKELLLPAIKDCILNVDLEKGIMTIHLMDGLLDLSKGRVCHEFLYYDPVSGYGNRGLKHQHYRPRYGKGRYIRGSGQYPGLRGKQT